MIEYALLFGLGFLTAALLAMLIAPAIHRRIVVYAENRLKATMPLSPQEVRAQRDMARAAFAAEQSRTQQELNQEREKRAGLQVQQEAHLREAATMRAEAEDLRTQISDMSREAGDLRNALRQEEARVVQAFERITALEADLGERTGEVEELRKQMLRVAADRDNFKIDLAARNTQFENDRYRMQTVREERDSLRREVKLLTSRAREAEQRLEQEEHKALRLSDKLAREQSALSDRENLIERRAQEIQRLREKIKAISAETREARRQLKAPPAERPRTRKSAAAAAQASGPEEIVSPDNAAEMKDAVRHQATALSDRFLKARTGAHDEGLREEMANLAARMVAITAAEEGPGSPIHDLLAKAPERADGSPASLAERIRAVIPQDG